MSGAVATWCGLCGPRAACACRPGVLVRRGALPRPPDRVQVADDLPAETRAQRVRELVRDAFRDAQRAGR
jgi:hypothetical protein